MRRIVTTALVGAAALGGTVLGVGVLPAHAASTSCNAVAQPGSNGPWSCTYTATMATGGAAVATANPWTIADNGTVVASGTQAPGPVSYTTTPGDTITITINSACDPTGNACGGVGGIAGGDNPAP